MIKRLQDAFYKSGLLGEFFETIINDGGEVLTWKLRRQIWTLVSTEWNEVDLVVKDVERAFAESTDECDLDTKWRVIVDEYWPRLPEMPLKEEVDAVGKPTHRVEFRAWTDDLGSPMRMNERFEQFMHFLRDAVNFPVSIEGIMLVDGKKYEPKK